MRPPVIPPARTPHLTPCPRCGESNGVTATSCWKCDLQLMPEDMLAPRSMPEYTAPPEEMQSQPAVPHDEVPPDVAQRIHTPALRRRDDPHTLPPFSGPTFEPTANEPSFAARTRPRMVQLVTALVLLIGGGLIGALIAGWTPRDDAGAAAARPPPPEPAAVPVVAPEAPNPAASQAQALTSMPLTAAAVSDGTAQPGSVAAAGPAPPAHPPQAQAPPEAQPSVNHNDDTRHATDVPPPNGTSCTPQVVALGLCASADR